MDELSWQIGRQVGRQTGRDVWEQHRRSTGSRKSEWKGTGGCNEQSAIEWGWDRGYIPEDDELNDLQVRLSSTANTVATSTNTDTHTQDTRWGRREEGRQMRAKHKNNKNPDCHSRTITHMTRKVMPLLKKPHLDTGSLNNYRPVSNSLLMWYSTFLLWTQTLPQCFCCLISDRLVSIWHLWPGFLSVKVLPIRKITMCFL